MTLFFIIATNQQGYVDIWKFNVNTKTWTWVGGTEGLQYTYDALMGSSALPLDSVSSAHNSFDNHQYIFGGSYGKLFFIYYFMNLVSQV